MADPISKEDLVRRIKVAESIDSDGPVAKTTPAAFIAKYYGGDEALKEELNKAAAYSKRKPKAAKAGGGVKSLSEFLSKDPKQRMFDAVEVKLRQGYGPSYNLKGEYVNTGGMDAADIQVYNNQFTKKFLDKTQAKAKSNPNSKLEMSSGVDLSKEDLKKIEKANKYLENTLYNEFGSEDNVVGVKGAEGKSDKELSEEELVDGLEHELGHYVYVPKGWGSRVQPRDVEKGYFNDEGELYQGLGRFQREYYQKTKTRITDPDELYDIIMSDEDLDFLSPEGSRVIHHLRKHKDSDKGRKRIRTVSELAPMFVSTDNENLNKTT